MAQKFKVGDLVYCRYYKEKGIVSYVGESRDMIRVRFATLGLHGERIYDLDGKSWFGALNKKSTLKKIKTFTPQDMLDFANYCISEGFTSDATKRDLVRFLNNSKK